MGIPLKEASDQVGVTRQTLMKAIKTGRISAEKTANGEWRIEPVELFRVWPAVKGVQHPLQSALTAGYTPDAPVIAGEVVDLLKAQIDLLKSQLDDVRADREDLRNDRNHWRQIAERGLLTDQRPASEQFQDTPQSPEVAPVAAPFTTTAPVRWQLLVSPVRPPFEG
ncbi:hypothetical protein QP185_22515 [Sphingomonas aerolata]|uniref:hypothetical protein n=1 Tax=Sphingomonas aerolata TaxID=185951 RepID=UPI002FE18AC1